MTKYFIPCLYIYKGKAVTGFGHKNTFASGNLSELSMFYSDHGADRLLVFDFSNGDADHDRSIACIKDICKSSQIPVYGAGNVKRVEDVKKLIYAGCSMVVLNAGKPGNIEILEEVSKRFGKDKIAVCISSVDEYLPAKELIEEYASMLLLLDNIDEEIRKESSLPIVLHTNHGDAGRVIELLTKESIDSISGSCVSGTDMNLAALKAEAAKAGIQVNMLVSSIKWEELKTDEKGLVPCIVQDYRNGQVLMMAYMNEESFRKTLETGRMTYYSRSRQSLWTKGETSGHFQYVKSMDIDCDGDTILAKVAQIGAACHTGNRSCFFTPLVETQYDDTNPLHVFQDVYDIIMDRKRHPKEGSYTNYLFDKGIDKILKKVGEENTEIIIAAKNPDPEEIKYEISDYLYHLMVLMAERGVTWDDITSELAKR
ncbi:MAG: bifunctional phosphoribosyl-AMP cyclohydrolase/phosphoribosyl-ATP diphosphatase HisIE [Lachnospiraceae bacterium]|nr:bifunctional phosphoribosyl-AMP cyclohydrolase/phosphoribosyl-ATP diphosphatase HisIE [Lachnospiraceae bacterium]